MTATNREELELIWRDRVADARLRHKFARSFLKDAREAYPSGDSPECESAIRAEIAAKEHFHRTLKLCNLLVLEGKIPDGDAWRNAGGA